MRVILYVLRRIGHHIDYTLSINVPTKLLTLSTAANNNNVCTIIYALYNIIICISGFQASAWVAEDSISGDLLSVCCTTTHDYLPLPFISKHLFVTF